MAYKLIPIAGSEAGTYGNTDAASGLDARFDGPTDCALSPDRAHLYVADYGNHAIRRVTLAGTFPVDTLATFSPTSYVVFLTVNPATGNIWTGSYEDADPNHHRLMRITPAGVVTTIYTTSVFPSSVLSDAAETYVRARMTTNDNSGIEWQLIDVAAGAYVKVVGRDGAFAQYSGQMWSRRHPDVWVYSRDYIPPSSIGAALLRDSPYGPPAELVAGFVNGAQTYKIVPGPDLYPPHETYLGVHADGRVVAVAFDADPAALWLAPDPARLDTLGLPPLPARTLERDQVTGTLYFPTSQPWGSTGSSGLNAQGVPANAIVLAVPDDDLSLSYA